MSKQVISHTDAEHPRLPAALTSEMSRLYSAGFSLIPLGGDDGKKPIIKFRDRARQPLAMVVDRMAAAGSNTYGIRLAGLLVVDIDTDTPEAREYVERRFGTSSAQTRTSRGFHLYFRYSGPKPKAIRLTGIAIDFKSGDNEFVVGAFSRRPDGVVYQSDGRLIAPAALPPFIDRDAGPGTVESLKIDGRYPKGVRWSTLNARARQLLTSAETFDGFLADLIAFRNWEIDQPQEFSDTRLAELARWYWDKREAGEIWGAANSVFQLRRAALEAFARQGYGLAFLLYAILVADHAHNPNRPFAVVPDGLRRSGRLRAGRNQIYAAIEILVEELGVLNCVSKPCGNRNHYRYRLASCLREERGEGSKIILVPESDTHSAAPKKGRAA